MNKTELQEILEDHRKWLKDLSAGTRADLSGADLRGARLCGANLTGANLSGADLSGAHLRDADLSGADLPGAGMTGADLRGANLCGTNLTAAVMINANLRYAYLCDADLSGADLSGADLSGADLSGADLSGADLSDADLYRADLADVKTDEHTKGLSMVCPAEGEFIAWKKAAGLIVKLKVPVDAKRSSATARKCRCSKAEVLAIEELDGAPSRRTKIPSDYDLNFVYEVGKTVEVENFDEDQWRECSAGIHFFMTREEAVDWV